MGSLPCRDSSSHSLVDVNVALLKRASLDLSIERKGNKIKQKTCLNALLWVECATSLVVLVLVKTIFFSRVQQPHFCHFFFQPNLGYEPLKGGNSPLCQSSPELCSPFLLSTSALCKFPAQGGSRQESGTSLGKSRSLDVGDCFALLCISKKSTNTKVFFDNGAKTSIEGSSNLHLSSIGALSKEISLITPSESLLYEFGLLGTLLFPFTNITQKNYP